MASVVNAVVVIGASSVADGLREIVATVTRGTQPPNAVTVVRRATTVIPIATLALGVIARLSISRRIIRRVGSKSIITVRHFFFT